MLMEVGGWISMAKEMMTRVGNAGVLQKKKQQIYS
jgi:hypothetical protein